MKISGLQKLGDEIRRRRVLCRLSQDVFAAKCGLHRTYVGSVERGERNVSLENILRIAECLDVKASELLRSAGL